MKNNIPPMRVCLVINTFHPLIGGGENHALHLSRALRERGVDVMVLTGRRIRGLPSNENIMGVPVIRVGPCVRARHGKYLALPAVLWWLLRRRRHYDLIYVCGLRVLGAAGVLAARWGRKNCILRAEARGELSGEFIWNSVGGGRRPRLARLLRPLIRLRNRLLIRHTRAWTSISSPVREEYIRHGVPASRIHDIPNGIDLQAYQPADNDQKRLQRRALQLPENRTIAVYTGKLIRGKGLPFLLRLWHQLTRERPGLLLVLVGSGGGQSISCEADLRDYIRHRQLENFVSITGYTDRVSDYLRAADCFLFPSESETLGLSVLEALACELPVVASQIPGISDIISNGNNGLLAPPNDTGAWLEAVNTILDDPERARNMARSGRTGVLARFSLEQDAALHADMFARCMGE